MKASLFLIQNETGQVLHHKIVPTDERVHIAEALSDIWNTPEREPITQAVYTDNAKSDINTIEATFANTHSVEDVENMPIDVCEVSCSAIVVILAYYPLGYLSHRAQGYIYSQQVASRLLYCQARAQRHLCKTSTTHLL